MSLNTQCHLQKNDWDFVMKLTRVAHVHVLTSQVSIQFGRNNRDMGTLLNDSPKLCFPENWNLQHVGILPSKYEDNHVVTMTFEILKPKEKA